MRMFLRVSSVLVLTCVCAFGTISTLPGTGFDMTGTPLAPGTTDAWWTMTLNPVDATQNAYFIAPGTPDWWGGYVANTNAAVFQGSGWISTYALSSYNGPVTPGYVFSMTFNLAGYDLNSVTIAGLWSIADGGTLAINGNVVDTLYEATLPWASMHAFTINTPGYFVPGANVMTITMLQSDSYFEAARFEGTVTGTLTGIPEPGTLLLLGSGLLGAVCVIRRKINL